MPVNIATLSNSANAKSLLLYAKYHVADIRMKQIDIYFILLYLLIYSHNSLATRIVTIKIIIAITM